ncbi:hypothetical protein ELY33_16965 [Vreelandella andesensis]|uniref:Uncharacterized protein n=1 Tax=Vreelandella andesensis TaxID=447567 RepID=A0A3S0Y099_9GAMM|nr:hypothetical protein [Halomonas andesensis]RUR26798.1 hypothetical protein ELY33_16965 [Halomonas andesensis]
MKRDELLTKLAMEWPHWPDFNNGEVPAPDAPGAWSIYHSGWQCTALLDDGSEVIDKSDWLARRTELINEPDDSAAPPEAKYKIQGSTGQWYWAWGQKPESITVYSTRFSGWNVEPMCSEQATKGQIPEGHKWHETLKRVERDVCTPEEDEEWALKERQLREAEWNGEGLPPVGTVCEVDYCEAWHECSVIAHFQQQAGMVAAFTVELRDNKVKSLDAFGAECFRPIRTQEQRAEDDLTTAIKRIHETQPDGISVSCDRWLARTLIAMGYRKAQP